MNHRQHLTRVVTDLRAAAKATSAAVARMAKVAAASNPERMLRLWTAEQRLLAAKATKTDKGGQ